MRFVDVTELKIADAGSIHSESWKTIFELGAPSRHFITSA